LCIAFLTSFPADLPYFAMMVLLSFKDEVFYEFILSLPFMIDYNSAFAFSAGFVVSKTDLRRNLPDKVRQIAPQVF
jgi:hypothetical protein